MAKKVIAKVKSNTNAKMAKVITTVKSSKTHAYTFKETVVNVDQVSELLAKANP